MCTLVLIVTGNSGYDVVYAQQEQAGSEAHEAFDAPEPELISIMVRQKKVNMVFQLFFRDATNVFECFAVLVSLTAYKETTFSSK